MRATGDHAKMVELICAERDELRAKVATLERELAAVWWDAWGAIWPVVGHCRETSKDWCEDVDKLERVERELAAVTAERDALGAERAMFCSVVDSLTAERDALERGSKSREVADRKGLYRHPDDCIAYMDQRWDAMTAAQQGRLVRVTMERDVARGELAEVQRERDTLRKTLAPTPPTGTPGDGTR